MPIRVTEVLQPDQEEVLTAALLADQPTIDPGPEHQDTEVRVVRLATGTQAEHLHTGVQEVVLPVRGVQDIAAVRVAALEVLVSAGVHEVVHVVLDSAGVLEEVHAAQEVCEALVVPQDLLVEGLPEEVVEAAEGINHPNILIS